MNLRTLSRGKKNTSKESFYDEKKLIIAQFQHLKTPKHILDTLKHIENENYSKMESWQYGLEIEFMKSSLKYRNQKGTPCDPVEVEEWKDPIISELDEEQLDWYLYWRTCYVNGQAIDVDIEYLMIFIFEIMNFTFNPKASVNISLMISILQIYGEAYHMENMISSILDSMFTEIGATEFIPSENRSTYFSGNDELYTALYHYEKDKKQDHEANGKVLAKISINLWKPYFSPYRKNQFSKDNRTKIYKTFKDCLFLLEEEIIAKGSTLTQEFFEKREDTHRERLYSGMIVYRKESRNLFQYAKVDVISPSIKMHTVITAYFRMSENVTRLLNGENRQLGLEKDVLSDELKEKMLENMQKPKLKKKKGRPKKVKEEEAPIVHPEVIIEFDNERIKQLQEETDNLVEVVDKRALEYQEETPIKEDIVVETKIEMKTPEEKTSKIGRASCRERV